MQTSAPARTAIVTQPVQWPFVEMGLDKGEVDELAGYLRSIGAVPKTPPKALLVVSAHREEPVLTVMTADRPPIYYDYYNFPPESYEITWPAPGHPQLAARVQELLGAAGFRTAANATRGFDHGRFIPLKLTYPDADVPAVQLSLKTGLDPEEHLAMGRALAPLRDEGVFILGSGWSSQARRGWIGARRHSTKPSWACASRPITSSDTGHPRTHQFVPSFARDSFSIER